MTKPDWDVKRWNPWEKWKDWREGCCDWKWNGGKAPCPLTPNTKENKGTRAILISGVASIRNDEEIYANWPYLYSSQAPTKGQGKCPVMVSAAMGYRGPWHFLDRAEGKENEQYHHTPYPLAAPARYQEDWSYSLKDWIILVCREAWPNEEITPGHMGSWKSISILRELEMRKAIYAPV